MKDIWEENLLESEVGEAEVSEPAFEPAPAPPPVQRRKVPLTARLWAKVMAFILAVLMVCTCGLSILAAVVMVNEQVYTTPKAQYRNNVMKNLASGDAYNVALLVVLEDNEAGAEQLLAHTNIQGAKIRFVGSSHDLWTYDRREAKSVPVMEETAEEIWDENRTFHRTLYWWQDMNREGFLTSWEDEEAQLLQTVKVSLYFDDRLTGQDDYWLAQTVIDAMYYFRYSVYVIMGVSALLAIACFIFLLSASGKHPDHEGVRPGWGTKVPVDVLTAGVFLAGGSVCALMDEATWSDPVTIAVVWSLGVIALLTMALGWCMSFALRLKLGGWWKNSLCWWCVRACVWVCKGCWKCVRACGRGIAGLVLAVPLVWKVMVVFGIITLCEFIVWVIFHWHPGDMLLWWGLEKLIFLPFVLGIALMLRKLERGGQAIAEGDLNYKVDTRHMLPVFKRHAENLNQIGEGMNRAVEERTKSERMKTELITNVSHDIKTPLTSIINYADLIGKEPCQNENITEYAEVLHRQSERLKRLIDDLVEASKASTGNLDISLTPCEVGVLLTQTAGEYEHRLREQGLELVTRQPDKPLKIMADGRRLWRVFDNLMNNVCKYGQSGTRVYLTLEKLNGQAVISFKNTSREELNLSPDELMERFVRGDAARKSEGSGLGLSIARSLTELQRGSMELTVDGDLFKVVLRFPIIP